MWSENWSENNHVQENDATFGKVDLEFKASESGTSKKSESNSKLEIDHLKSDPTDLLMLDKKENYFYTFILQFILILEHNECVLIKLNS